MLEQDEVDFVDDEEEESEAHVDYIVNLFGTSEYTGHTEVGHEDQEELPLSYVFCLPQHTIDLNFNKDDPSLDPFYNPSQ